MTQNERMFLPLWKKIIIIITTLIVFAIQIVIFILAFQVEFNREYHVAMYYLIQGVAFVVVLHIIHKPVLTSYKLTWSILILLLPLPFILLYYLNHSSKRLPKNKHKKINEVLKDYIRDNGVIDEVSIKHPKVAKLAKVVNSCHGEPLYKNTKYTFLKDGEIKFRDFINELKLANKYVFIETFIIGEGELLNELYPILKEKGEAGVEIKILYDDLGSTGVLKAKTVKDLALIPNCEIVNYNPLGLNINPAFNYRDHRKIIVIDGKIAYCGGDNLADEYIHKKERFGFWRDNCGKYEGDAVKTFIGLFLEMWYLSTKVALNVEKYICETDIINNDSFVMPYGDGPSNNADPGYDVFRTLTTFANKTLYISTPYFIVDDAIVENIVLAARSGVDVRILMPGIPDKKTAFYLARSRYGQIIKAGGKIYEYTPGFNHAKNVIVDNETAFIGTINMDYRSLFLHYECGALVFLDEEVKLMQEDFLDACSKSKLITYEDWKKRPWWQKIVAYLLYLLSPMF